MDKLGRASENLVHRSCSKSQREGGETMYLYEYIHSGGMLMYILLIMNVVGLAIMIAKFITFAKHKNNLSTIVDELIESVKANAQPSREANSTIELAKQEISQYMAKIDKGLNSVKIIASVSPLIGLLGTVVGVLLAFQAMSREGMGDPNFFAHGISMALVTTVGGMVVAIPHFIGHSYLIGMLDDLESGIERAVLNKIL